MDIQVLFLIIDTDKRKTASRDRTVVPVERGVDVHVGFTEGVF
jgi:hypothetical protein